MKAPVYKTFRNISRLEITHKPDDAKQLNLKQSVSIFDRRINVPSYLFAGREVSSFTDISYSTSTGKHSMVSGMSLQVTAFKERQTTSRRNNFSLAGGIYSQYTSDLTDGLKPDGWEGTVSGRRALGSTYVWYAEGIDQLGKKMPVNGSLTLIR